MLLSNCRAWNELCLSYLWLFLFLYIASIIYTALLDLNYYSYARVNNSCGGEVERKSMWWCTFVLCYNSLVKQESTELYAALNIKAVRTKMCQEQYHISFKRVAKFGFFFLYVGTLEFLSRDNVCIRSPIDEHNVPARSLKGNFFQCWSCKLVN